MPSSASIVTNSHSTNALPRNIFSSVPAIGSEPNKNLLISNLFLQARSNLNEKKYDEAVVDCNTLLTNYNYLPALILRGYAYFQSSNFSMAIKDFDIVLGGNPSANMFFLRAQAYIGTHEYEKAIQDFSYTIKLETNNAYAFLLRGNMYFLINNFSNSISDYTVATRINPNYAIAYANRGQVFCNIGLWDEGMDDFEQAIKLDPTCVMALNNYAWQLAVCQDAEKRDGKKSLIYAKKACDLTKWDDPQCLGTLAAAYAEVGNFEEAVKFQKKSMAGIKSEAELKAAQSRLDLFQKNKPYRTEKPNSATAPR